MARYEKILFGQKAKCWPSPLARIKIDGISFVVSITRSFRYASNLHCILRSFARVFIIHKKELPLKNLRHAFAVVALLIVIQSVWAMEVYCADFAPPTVDAKVFGDKNPAPFDPSKSKGMPNGALNLRDFSSSLTRAELSNVIANMPVSESIRQAIVECAAENYPAYIAAHGEVATRNAQKYIGMCGDLATQRNLTGEDPSVEKYREQVNMAKAFERELIASEQGFIQLVQDCFNKSEAAKGQDSNLLESWRLRAAYRYAVLDLGRNQRGTDLALRSFINQLNLELSVRQELETELRDYERSLAALKPAQIKAFMERSPQFRALYLQLADNIISGESCVTQINKLAAISGNIGVQIRNETLAVVARIRAKLPLGKQSEFERMVRKAMFGELEEDAVGYALGESFASARTNGNLPSETIARIQFLQEEWNLELAVWRVKTETLLLEWSDGYTSGIRKYDSITLDQMLNEQFQKRSDLHDRWRSILEDQIS